MLKEQVISSILGGHSVGTHASQPGSFLTSIAIDPETQVNSTILKPGAIINPILYQKFSSTGVSGAPMWIETTPKNELIYTYNSDGEFISYNTTFTETVIGTPTSGAGNGMEYYNNYLYLTTPTDVSRYGPLNSSPSLSNTFWTSTLSLTALTNTTYPGFNSVSYGNHALHPHVDNKLYICDFKNGQGLIHFIKTTKTTDEGDTNDGSTYNALDLPFGYAPFAMASWGTDLAIIASQVSTSTVIKQGQSALFLWDTFSPTFYRQIPIPESVATAIINHRGLLYIWAGSIEFGYKLYRYSGGYDVEPLETFMEGSPPFAGAVDAAGNRLMWGASITYPEAAAVVMSRGYVNSNLPGNAVNSIGRVTGTGTFPVISALKQVQQAQRVAKPIIGWRTTTPSEYGLDRVGVGTLDSIFRSDLEEVGKSFVIKEIEIPLTTEISANMTITPTVYVDDETASFTGSSNGLDTINSTNFSDSERLIPLKPEGVRGENNFYLELAFSGTVALPVALPIRIKYSVEETAK
jgi:hypothetical protein